MTIIKTLLLVIALTITTHTFSQTKPDCEEKPYIEVTGSADQEVIPDEIYINIIFREKYENREKITIASQEEKLKTHLKEIGIDAQNLYLSDANADYVKVKWGTKDVLTKKDYTLKVNTATSVGQVFQVFDQLDITDAYVSRVNHSKIDSLKKEVKIQAIKAAKNKADYLLAAIGEQTGKALIVEERERTANSAQGVNYRGARADGVAYYIDGVRTGSEDKTEEVQFKKIKIEAFIYVKFAIK